LQVWEPGPVALERLTRREDGRYEYRTRKGQVLEFTGQGLVKRLVALIPPKGVHLTRFHGGVRAEREAAGAGGEGAGEGGGGRSAFARERRRVRA
jgi:hypothetical protein